MADVHERRFSWRAVFTKANAKPRQGADVELAVVVTLREAYCGTTRVFIYQLASGEKRSVEVSIPPGVATGTRVRCTGYGLSGQKGGSPGNLYLVIEVQLCPGFSRQGTDLSHQCFVPLSGLALGAIVQIKTLDGRTLNLSVPPGTTDGQQFRLAGEGMPQLHQPDQRGDLFVTVTAQLPGAHDAPSESVASAAPDDLLSGVVTLAVTFVAGIGAGLLLSWLMFD